MTTEIQTIQEITPAHVDRTTEWWPRLLKSPLADQAERDMVARQIRELLQPAEPAQLMARIAALLASYYTGDVPQGVRMIEAEDWAEVLAEYPEWAVIKACRWWKSDANEYRRRRPLEGDIADRCKREMGVIRVAEMAVSRFDEGRSPFSPVPEQGSNFRAVDPEMKRRAQEIVDAAGFGFRRAAE